MKIALSAAAVFLAATAARAEPLFDCAGADKEKYETVCADVDLVGMAKQIDAHFDRLVDAADPLAAVLLKRDQRWFADVVGAENAGAFEGGKDENYLRMHKALQNRLSVLGRINPAAGGLTGNWANALASVKIGKDKNESLSIAITARLDYPSMNETLTCTLRADTKPGADGWYSGLARTKDDDASGKIRPTVRFRLQGNTLRVVASDGEQTYCSGTNVVTGSYFPTGGQAPGKNSARAVAPSFACAGEKNAHEEETCADPELAQRDNEMARAYRQVLARLEPKAAEQLRADQRAWIKDNLAAFEFSLNPSWDKRAYDTHHTTSAREEFSKRLSERVFMLGNIEERRKGMEGRWVSHDSELTIGPGRGKAQDRIVAEGGKTEAGDYKSYCDYRAEGRLENGLFKTDEKDFPQLARDGPTLTVDKDDPGSRDDYFDKSGTMSREPSGYCHRLFSAKARLFPVKAKPDGKKLGNKDRSED